ncbi:MAG: SLBB domain-containing protein [Phycisphaeraceae bacterium]|nr:SLBB domain-containing protein [Phycisphaeraceae bacterium]
MSGHVNQPGCYEFDLGIPLRTFVEQYCGGMQRQEVQGRHPRRRLHGHPRHRPVRRRTRLRHRPQAQRPRPRHRLPHRLR